jgi:H+/Cl- antiporter ClcA
VLAALGTLAFGAVLGPEMPVIAIGSAVALLVTLAAPLEKKEHQILGMAGSFSAISALFGGPIVGGVMLLEAGVGLGAALIPVLLPGFVAAAVGYVVFVGLGDWGGLATPGLVVPNLPLYQGTHIYDLVIPVVVGVVAAIVLAIVRQLATRPADEGERRLSMPVFLLGGGLAVGVTAVVADLLGADSQEILFSGQASVPEEVATTSAWTVLLLLVAKTIGYAVSLASGFRGGPIFPAVFLGIGLATFPIIWFDTSPTLAIAIGAAAGMAAQTRLLLTSILFGALLVGTQGLDTVPADVLAAAAAWLAATALQRRGA